MLLVVPWSAFWERNYFVTGVPVVRDALLNHFARGAISGVGLVCLGAALGELASMLAQRGAQAASSPDGGEEGTRGRG